MEQQIPVIPDNNQMDLIQKKLKLESNLRNGVSWFFWIGALSIINSLIFLFDGSSTFIFGLAITQYIDGFASAFAEYFVDSGTIIQIIGFCLDLLFAGLFFVFGILGRKRHRWAVITGLILYVLDAILFIFVKDWLALAFHGFAIWGLCSGLRALNQLATFEKAVPLSYAPSFPAVTDPVDSNHSRSKTVIGMILIISGILVALVTVYFVTR